MVTFNVFTVLIMEALVLVMTNRNTFNINDINLADFCPLTLKDISKREQCSIHDICSLIHLKKNPLTSLTAAIRVFIMLYYRAATSSEGHIKAGHGNFEYMKQRARIYTDLKSFQATNNNLLLHD